MGKEKKHKATFEFVSLDLLIFIWQKRILLAGITLVAAMVSIVVSLTITPLFRSTVVMFPASNASVSKNLISDNFIGDQGIYEIGTELEAEQLLQILNSEEIRNRIINKYNLLEHYKISPGSKFPQSRLRAKFKKNIRFRLTEYMSVVIDVMDHDPQMAADIANDIAALTDTVFNKMLKQRSYEAFLLVEKEIEDLNRGIKAIRDSLDFIRRMGVNNYETQAERYYEAYGKALLEGNNRAVDILEQKIKTISRYGGAYVSLSYLEEYELERLSRIRQKYAEARLEMDQSLPHKFIVDPAYSAEKKAYPKKSIIVLLSTFSAFLFGLIVLIILENLKSNIKG